MLVGSITTVAILVAASTGSALQGQGGTDVCANPSLRGAAVSSVLTLTSAYQDHLSITEQTKITVPDTWTGAKLLIGQNGSPWTALGCFLPTGIEIYRASPPTITEANSKIIVDDSTTVTAYPSDQFFSSQDQWSTSLWTVTRDQAGFNVAFADNEHVPVKWTVTLRAHHLNITGENHFPTTDDGKGDLTWDFTSKANQEVSESAYVALPTLLAWEWDAWSLPTATVVGLLNVISYGLAFYVILLLLSRRFAKRPGASQYVADAARSVRSLAGLGILLLMVGYCIDLLNGYASRHLVPQHLIAAMAAVISFTAGLTLCFPKRQHPRLGKIPFLAITLLGVLGFATLLPAQNIFPANLLPLTLAIFLFYTGIALWTCRLWPLLSVSPERQTDPRPVRLRREQVRLCFAAAAILTVVDTLGPILTANRDWGHWFLVGPAASRFEWIANSTAYVTEQLWLNWDLQTPLFLLVTLAFFTVLRQSAQGQDVLFPVTGNLEVWSVAALLGFVFEGYFGDFSGIPVPIALLLFMLGFRYIAFTKKGTPDIARGLRTTTGAPGGSRLLSHNKGAFYDAAERVADLTSQLSGVANGNGDSAGNGNRARLRAEIEGLKVRIPVPGTAQQGPRTPRRGIRRLFREAPAAPQQEYLSLPRPYDPARVLLDSGPAANWWDNGMEAVRSGMLLIVLAVAFTTYNNVRNGNVQPLAFGFGLTHTLFAALNYALAWAVVAFAFGACLPYIRGIRGPVKGLVVSLVHAAALGLADWFFYAIGATRSPDYVIHSLVFLFFLTTLGVLLDVRTVRRYGGSTGLFGRIYRLGDARAAVAYIAAIIVTVLGIWQQASTLSQANAQRAQEGQQIVQNLSSMYGSGSAVP